MECCATGACAGRAHSPGHHHENDDTENANEEDTPSSSSLNSPVSDRGGDESAASLEELLRAWSLCNAKLDQERGGRGLNQRRWALHSRVYQRVMAEYAGVWQMGDSGSEEGQGSMAGEDEGAGVPEDDAGEGRGEDGGGGTAATDGDRAGGDAGEGNAIEGNVAEGGATSGEEDSFDETPAESDTGFDAVRDDAGLPGAEDYYDGDDAGDDSIAALYDTDDANVRLHILYAIGAPAYLDLARQELWRAMGYLPQDSVEFEDTLPAADEAAGAQKRRWGRLSKPLGGRALLLRWKCNLARRENYRRVQRILRRRRAS